MCVCMYISLPEPVFVLREFQMPQLNGDTSIYTFDKLSQHSACRGAELNRASSKGGRVRSNKLQIVKDAGASR